MDINEIIMALRNAAMMQGAGGADHLIPAQDSMRSQNRWNAVASRMPPMVYGNKGNYFTANERLSNEDAQMMMARRDFINRKLDEMTRQSINTPYFDDQYNR